MMRDKSPLMRLLYNILFVVFFLLSAPFYFWKMWRRGNWRAGFGQRFARYTRAVKQTLTNREVLWIHAVSVGEVNVCTALVEALAQRLPHHKIVVSTTTSTGMGELRKKLPQQVEKIYYPVDFASGVARAFRVVHPSAIVLVEAEIWPNFLWRAADHGVPVFLVNARVSEKSFRGYRRFGVLFRELFGSFAAVGAQNHEDVPRLAELGAPPARIAMTGCLKFDTVKLSGQRKLDVPALLRQLGVVDNALLLVAGSTHDGEEKLLAQQYLRLKARFPDLFLILVPRHFERTKSVVEDLRSCGVKFALRSEMTPATQHARGEVDCLLVNTTGELVYFYEQATVCFVGKSITARGGQNPIEPGALGKAMVFGPNMQNFVAVTTAFLNGDGAVQVSGAEELEKTFAELLGNEPRRAELARNALKVVQANQGAVERTADLIAQRLLKS
jgi:3-deoxy-D-manno-octulosonic-acid transferase